MKDVVFHALRACFATHLLSTGVEPLKVMRRMGGWSDLKTFQIYLRMSGVDVRGVAEGLGVIADTEVTDNVFPLFSFLNLRPVINGWPPYKGTQVV